MKSPATFGLLCRLFGGVIVAVGVISVGGCPGPTVPPGDMNDDTTDCPKEIGTPVSFSQDIQPIFNFRCTVCHVTRGLADDEGIDLRLVAGESYAGLVNQQSVQDASLTLVVPGDSSQSLLWMKVSMDNPPVGGRMPFLLSTLDDGCIELIRRWIDEGALDN